MGFDENKVAWSADEIVSAKAADALYELFEEAMADGIGFDDLTAIPAAVPHILVLYSYLAEGTKVEYANKLIALGVMLLRDNEFLEAIFEDDENEG